MAPQVPHPERLEESAILPVNGHICRKGVELEDRDVVAVVSKVRECGTGSALPSDQIVKARQNALPFGQIRTVSFALNVAFNAARIRVLLPVAQVVLIERPGEREPDRTSAQCNGFGISLNIGDVETVVVRARSYRVELDEIDAPRCIQVDDGVDLLLRPRLGEIDLVSVAKSVTYSERLRYDVLSIILRTENRQILRVNRRANSGEQIDTDFLPVGMDVLNHVQEMRERSRVPERATVLISTAAPARIKVDVT